ncbi:MAG: YggS family pyridoxal phosphate-dependent enzyme [Thermodesulfobacteriota bacterium]|nr:YggS family pyridoxal phosphate-dependent enzyme [Thermodesulfobacteriota bacterium]
MEHSVIDNLLRVRERIEKAAIKSGRSPDDITLVAVSKMVRVEKIKKAISAGVTILGENYLQEAKTKIEEIGESVQWHMIGHLQTNKVKQAIALFDLIQSVDRLHLAQEIHKKAKKLDKVIRILVQVNISEEDSKSGIESKNAVSLISEISKLENIRIEGLMTIPPYLLDPQRVRPYFRSLRKLSEEIVRRGVENTSIKELSMGMSNDFDVAIEEGATIVRVGTAIFGERG